MRTVAAVATLILLAASTARAEDQAARDSASLIKLRDEVRKSLPPGWRAEVTPETPREIVENIDFHFDRCRLLVWHEEKTLGRWNGPNGPGRLSEEEAELDFKSVTPTLDLIVTKHFTPAEFEKAAGENIAHQRQRLDFEKQNLGPAVFMGSRPYPPSAYRPETPERKELVRQYALLWTQTEPQPLPTHSFEQLSLEVRLRNDLELKDPQISKQRHDLETAILRLLTAYPEKNLPTE